MMRSVIVIDAFFYALLKCLFYANILYCFLIILYYLLSTIFIKTMLLRYETGNSTGYACSTMHIKQRSVAS